MVTPSHRRMLPFSNTAPRARVLAIRAGASLAMLLVAVLVSASLPAVAQDSPVKIAVVDLDSVVANSPAGRALAARLEQFQEAAQTEMDQMSETAKGIQQRVAEDPGLAAADLAALQQQLEEAQLSMRRFADDKQREGRKMQEEGLKEIERSLEPVFVQIRDEGGYDLILNNVPGVVVMAGDRIDITSLVIERLQASSN